MQDMTVFIAAPKKSLARSIELTAGRACAVLEIAVGITPPTSVIRPHRAKDVIIIKTLSAGILSFNLRGVAPSVVGNILDERFGICVRTGLHCAPGAHALYDQPEGGVRVSPGWFTTEEDIKTLIGAIREIADELVNKSAVQRGAAGTS